PFGLSGLDERARCLVEGTHVVVDEPLHARAVRLPLLDHQLVELRVSRCEADEVPDDEPRACHRIDLLERADPAAETLGEDREDVIDRDLPEVLLAREVVGDEALVYPGPGGDVPRPRAFESPLCAGLERRNDDPFPRIPRALLPGARRAADGTRLQIGAAAQ